MVQAGLEVVRRHGVGGLTMRRVADHLGTGPMSLYRHVADKQELLVLMLDEVAAGCPPPPPHPDPVTRLVQSWLVVHDYLGDQSWVVEVLSAGEIFAPRALRLLDIVAATMTQAGFTPDETIQAYHAIWHLVLGSLANRRAWQPEVRAKRLALLASIPLDDLPDAARLLGQIGDREILPDVEGHLRALVEGILRTSPADRKARLQQIH